MSVPSLSWQNDRFVFVFVFTRLRTSAPLTILSCIASTISCRFLSSVYSFIRAAAAVSRCSSSSSDGSRKVTAGKCEKRWQQQKYASHGYLFLVHTTLELLCVCGTYTCSKLCVYIAIYIRYIYVRFYIYVRALSYIHYIIYIILLRALSD